MQLTSLVALAMAGLAAASTVAPAAVDPASVGSATVDAAAGVDPNYAADAAPADSVPADPVPAPSAAPADQAAPADPGPAPALNPDDYATHADAYADADPSLTVDPAFSGGDRMAYPPHPADQGTCTYKYNWSHARNKYKITGTGDPAPLLHILANTRLISLKDVSRGRGVCAGSEAEAYAPRPAAAPPAAPVPADRWWITFRIRVHQRPRKIEILLQRAGLAARCRPAREWVQVCGQQDQSE